MNLQAKNPLTFSKLITPRQFKKLAKELDPTSPDYFLVHLTWMTGLRVTELVSLTWTDIDTHDQYLKVQEGKGKKPRTIFFGPRTAKLLEELKEKFPPKAKDSFLFLSQKRSPFDRSTVHRRFKTILRKADLPSSLSFHSLRHGYATRMLDEGVHLHELKTQLGHTSISTTAIYLHFTMSSREKFSRVC